MFHLLRDVRLLLAIQARDSLRNPGMLLLGVLQPVLWLLLFAPLLESLITVESFGAETAIHFFAPGMLIMLAVTSTLMVGLGIIADIRDGVIERLRVTPVKRAAVPLSFLLRDWIMLLLQTSVMLVVAIMIGLRPHPYGLPLAVMLVSLVGLTVSAASYGLALLLRNEYALSSIANLLVLPLILLSGVTLPLNLAPPVLRAIGRANPFSHAVDAARSLISGQFGHPSIGFSFSLFSALFLAALFWVIRGVSRATR